MPTTCFLSSSFPFFLYPLPAFHLCVVTSPTITQLYSIKVASKSLRIIRPRLGYQERYSHIWWQRWDLCWTVAPQNPLPLLQSMSTRSGRPFKPGMETSQSISTVIPTESDENPETRAPPTARTAEDRCDGDAPPSNDLAMILDVLRSMMVTANGERKKSPTKCAREKPNAHKNANTRNYCEPKRDDAMKRRVNAE